MNVAPIDAAGAYFAAGRYADAIRLWDEAGFTRGPEYTKAKAFTEPYPKRVVPLGVLKLWAEIAREYDKAPGAPLAPEQTSYVVNALCEVGRAADAFRVGWDRRCADALFRLAIQLREADPAVASRSLHGAIIALAEQGAWDQIGALVQTTGFRPTPEWSGDAIDDWFASLREQVLATVVRALARETALDEAPEQFRRKWSEFLRDHLRVKEGRWRRYISVEEAGSAFERAGRFTTRSHSTRRCAHSASRKKKPCSPRRDVGVQDPTATTRAKPGRIRQDATDRAGDPTAGGGAEDSVDRGAGQIPAVTSN